MYLKLQVDGYIARRFPGQSSMLGSVLDPLADKCLASVLFITLTVMGLIPGSHSIPGRMFPYSVTYPSVLSAYKASHT